MTMLALSCAASGPHLLGSPCQSLRVAAGAAAEPQTEAQQLELIALAAFYLTGWVWVPMLPLPLPLSSSLPLALPSMLLLPLRWCSLGKSCAHEPSRSS